MVVPGTRREADGIMREERERTQRKVINADILLYIDVEKSSQEGDKIQAVGTTDDYTIRYTKELHFI